MKTHKIQWIAAVIAVIASTAYFWPSDAKVDASDRQKTSRDLTSKAERLGRDLGLNAEVSADFGAWAMEPLPEPDFAKIEAFERWVEAWKSASPEERAAMVEEGKRLAGGRRAEFKALIAADPRQAVERSVSRVVRQDLPAAIVAELETPVSATGDLNVYKGRPAPGMPLPPEGLTLRYFEAEGMSYKARVYGELEPLMSAKQIPMRGVAIDREFAIAESPVRPLEIGERIPAGTVVEDVCPVSEETTEAVATGEPVTEETPTIEVGERVITLCNGSHVTVVDEKYRVLVQAAGSGSSFFMDAHPGTAAEAIGNLRCLYIRATYPDQMAAPNTEDQALLDMQNNARFYLENSYGKLTSTYTVTPLIVLPQTLKWYQDKDSEVDGLGVIHNQARAEARKLGYDSNQYNCIILRVNGGLRSGASWGGGDSVWLGWGGMDVINHEIGHSLGVGHANYWQTTDGTPYGNGSNQEYGNPFDVMGGGGGFAAHYNSRVKRNLGWLPNSYVHFPKTNGVYHIHAFDHPRLEEGKRYSFSVAKNNSISYDIEYHATNNTLSNQALVLYGSRLIDTTPGSSGGKNDGGIQLGRTYSDPESDQHFTLLSINPTSPPSIDLAYQRGPFPGNTAPTATLAASATSVAVGGSVTFTATANDAEGDALAYHWQFSDGTTAENSAVVTRSFSSAAHVTAMLTVSDMKGGTVRRSVTITAGAPSTRTISGTITDGVAPLAGVLVSEGSNNCYTGSDGTYTLANVGTGSRTLSASLAGHTFTPVFTNPVNVSSNVTGADWTAAGSTFVTLQKTADANEGGSNGNFRLTRTGDTTAALAVSVAAITGTATKTTDYTLAPDVASNTFTIPAGSATLDIVVAAVNDTAQEGPETIALQLVSGAGYWSGSANSVVMTLIDNDTTLPQVAVTAPDPEAFEASNPGAFLFTRTGSTASSLNVAVAWSGSATNGSDYQTLPATVTIPAGQASVAVPVTVLDDSAAEVPEDIIATINTNAAYVRDSSATTATVTLSDDDTPYVSVTTPDASASEAGADTAVFLIHRTGPTTSALKVYYGLSGSASHGTDFRQLNGEVIIPAGASSAPVVITPYDDSQGEGAETVTLAVATYNNAYSLGENYQGTVTISDNADIPVIAVRAGSIGTEGGTNPTITFRSIGSAPGNVTVNYTVSGSATAGSDYTALSGSVTVPATGPSDVSVTIPVINDTLAEGTESVVVTITPGATYQIYNDGTATALIRDNDSGAERVAVSAYHTAAAEGGADGRFYFSRPGTTGDLTVNYGVSGTAVNGTDYTALPGTVVIPDGSSGVVVNVTPVNDTEGEGTETVVVTVLSGTGYSVDLPSSATVEINDNDATAVTVGFAANDTVTNEQPGANGQFRDVSVVLSAAATAPVTVTCVGASGSTASGDDIDWVFVDPDNGNAVIPAASLVFATGETSRTVRIRVKNDGFSEPIETAVLELRAPNGASLTANKNRHTVWIADSVTPTFATEERWSGGSVYTNQTWSSNTPIYTGVLPGFTTQQNVADNYSRRVVGQIVAPATGTYRFWVASDDASRLYLSTTSSAANKVQIASVSGWTNFQAWDANASQASGNISLVAGQSYYLEAQQQEGGGGDHLSVAWEGPGFTRRPISFEAEDNSPRTVRFAVASSSVTEADGGDPMLMVMLDRPAGTTGVTVDVSVGGTATAGSDFTLAPGTLTFAPGELVKPLPLVLVADATGEMPEAIVVSLSNPSGAQVTSPSSHVITVRDADAPAVATVQFTATSAMSAGTVIGTMNATVASGRSVTGWTILAGNEGNVFAINAAGQVSLLVPGVLPNPGPRQLLVRATDSAGATGDGTVNIVCNPPAFTGVSEQRWAGGTAYNTQNWTGTPNYTGTLATFTTAQNVAENYSRRLIGYLQPAVSGEYTFWVASDDASRLFLSTNAQESNKVQIASVAGWTNFQSWDSNASQRSAPVTLVAGQVYWMEVHQQEGGGGDHASVAWQPPGGSRTAIPASALFPNAFGTAPQPPLLALTSPGAGSVFDSGDNIVLDANVVGGSLAVSAVEFYRGSTLIGSDSSAPYSVTWTDAVAGNHVLTARAVYSGGGVSSAGVSITVENTDPAADPDGDGFTTGLELALGTDPESNASQPPAIYAGLRAWWKLDEASGSNADDTTGRPQDGTVSGAAGGSGISGGALDFDGIDDGVLVGTSAALLGSGDFSLAAWVKVDPGSPAGTVIQQREPGATGYQGEYMLNVNANGTVNFFVYGTSAFQFDLTTTAAINDGQWRHITALRQGSTGKIYIDGVEAASGSGTVQALLSRAVAIGYDHRDLNKRFDGGIDDVRIYERALSAGEIDGLHEDLVPNRAPAFTADPIVKSAATEDAAYAGSLVTDATDPDFGDTRTFEKVSGPSWLSVATDGTLFGTPTNSDVGPNSFTVRVIDAAGLSDDAELSIIVTNVNDAPVFAADPIPDGNAAEDSAYSGTLAGTASDVDADDTLSYSKVSGPAWLNVAANGTLSGTPENDDVGSNSFIVRVTDGGGLTDEAAFNVNVTNVNDAPAFAADPMNGGNATEDSGYSGTLAGAASDVDTGDTLSYSKVSGPSWLSIAPNGALSGTPGNGDVGSNSFNVLVTDGGGLTDEAVFNVTVINVNDAPAFVSDPIAGAAATEDTIYAGSLAAADIDAGDSLAFAKVDGPAWLIVASNGELSGLPSNSDVGSNSFIVRVTDGSGAFDEAVLNLTVSNVNDAPVFTVDPIVRESGSEGDVYTGTGLAGIAVAADAGDSLTFSKVSGPSWLTVAADGNLGGTPGLGTAGSNVFVVRVTDGTGAFAEATLTIEVSGASLPVPWVSGDVGTGIAAGFASHASGVFSVSGAGTLSGRNDTFHFVHQTLSGDGEIIARINSLQNTGTSSRVGVMIRDTLATNSRHVFMGLTGTNAYRWVRRTSNNGTTSTTNSSTGTVPNTWVRLTRVGNVITAFKSSNGTNWTQVGSLNASFPANCYVGLVVASGSTGTLNTSSFGQVTVTP